MAMKRKITERSGPKSPWSPEMMNDLVDNVANNQHYQRKLIFTNSPTASNTKVYTQIVKEMDEHCKKEVCGFELNVNQTRNKFKKLMSICKTALLTIKTASGIKRFQDEKQYGTWFNWLLQLMKRRASCQPGQAVEPGVASTRGDQIDTGENTTSSSDESDRADAVIVNNSDHEQIKLSSTAESRSKTNQLYVPVKGSKTKQSNDKQSSSTQLNEMVDHVRTLLENDQKTNQQILQFFECENERSRKHELELFKIMFQSMPVQSTPSQSLPSNPVTAQTLSVSAFFRVTPFAQSSLKQPISTHRVATHPGLAHSLSTHPVHEEPSSMPTVPANI